MSRCNILFILLISLFFVSGSALTTVPHSTENIVFQSNHFSVEGELRIPETEGKHPLVIMVHGDGPAYRTYFYKIKETILRAGYATFTWDKPGCGKSAGKISGDNVIKERTKILMDAIEKIKVHPSIDADHIGVWGISQAGYVIPKALEKTNDISFMIMIGCAGENGIKQSAYQIKRQLQFAGFSEDEAKQAEDHFVQLFYAKTFKEYIIHARPLYDNPVQRKLGFVSALWDEHNWKPHDPQGEGFYDPMTTIENVTIPALIFFGEKDTQVDPVQGADAYKKALQKAGNNNFKIELVPDSDHNIILCETGSVEERNRRTRRDWSNYAPEYLKIMEEWLKALNE